jgi:hypothetical protein
MTLLTLFADLDLMPCLTVAKDSVTLMLGSLAIVRGRTIDEVLMQAALRVVGQPIAKGCQDKLNAWIHDHEKEVRN